MAQKYILSLSKGSNSSEIMADLTNKGAKNLNYLDMVNLLTLDYDGSADDLRVKGVKTVEKEIMHYTCS
jgi:GH18 family chitinase